MRQIRDVGIYDDDKLIYVVKDAESYSDAFERFKKETGKIIPQSGYGARNMSKQKIKIELDELEMKFLDVMKGHEFEYAAEKAAKLHIELLKQKLNSYGISG